MEADIPVLDLSAWQRNKEQDGENLGQNALQFAADVTEALGKYGCVVLKNHRLNIGEIRELFDAFGEFFEKPLETKMQYMRPAHTIIGFHPCGRMYHDGEKDLIEGFNFQPPQMKPEDWPEPLVPGIQDMITRLHNDCFLLSMELLRALATVLKPEDTEFFTRAFIAEKNVNIRYNCYKPVLQDTKPNQCRFGQHKDLATLTMLFGDGKRGLQVELPDGRWADAHVAPDNIFINCGSLMEIWTADIVKAVVHRVVVPDGPERLETRRSLAAFFMPDSDFVVKCMDGSDTYQPVSAKEHIARIFSHAHRHM